MQLLSKNKHFAGVMSEAFVNLKSLELHTSKIQELASLFRTYLSLHKLIISITSDSRGRKSTVSISKYTRNLIDSNTNSSVNCFLMSKNNCHISGFIIIICSRRTGTSPVALVTNNTGNHEVTPLSHFFMS